MRELLITILLSLTIFTGCSNKMQARYAPTEYIDGKVESAIHRAFRNTYGNAVGVFPEILKYNPMIESYTGQYFTYKFWGGISYTLQDIRHLTAIVAMNEWCRLGEKNYKYLNDINKVFIDNNCGADAPTDGTIIYNYMSAKEQLNIKYEKSTSNLLKINSKYRK